MYYSVQMQWPGKLNLQVASPGKTQIKPKPTGGRQRKYARPMSGTPAGSSASRAFNTTA